MEWEEKEIREKMKKKVSLDGEKKKEYLVPVLSFNLVWCALRLTIQPP